MCQVRKKFSFLRHYVDLRQKCVKRRALHLKLHSHFVLILVVDVGRSVPGSKLCAAIIEILSGDEAVDLQCIVCCQISRQSVHHLMWCWQNVFFFCLQLDGYC